jgi:hypothetical protein
VIEQGASFPNPLNVNHRRWALAFPRQMRQSPEDAVYAVRHPFLGFELPPDPEEEPGPEEEPDPSLRWPVHMNGLS